MVLSRINLTLIFVFLGVVFLLSTCSLTDFQRISLSDEHPPAIKISKNKQCILNAREHINAKSDLYKEIANNLSFSLHQQNSRIDKHLKRYTGRNKYFSNLSKRAKLYLHHVIQELKHRELPTELALLPIVESGYDPFAYSHGRAAGMWQFIPSTGRLYKLKQNWWLDQRRDITASTTAALDFLEDLQRSFNGDWLLALAAYNAGTGTVSRAIKKNKKRGLATDFWSLDLPKETKDYVPKLIAISQIIHSPKDYDISLPFIPSRLMFDRVPLDSQIDLALAAELARVSLAEIYKLNPGVNRWATDPDGPHSLLIAYDSVYTFKKRLQQLDHNQTVHWSRYTIKPGDTLKHIATQHQVTVNLIQEINALTNGIIFAGDTLLIPSPSKQSKQYVLSAEQRKKALALRKRSGKKKIFYTTQENDSFWKIARSYNVSVQSLAAWNSMSPKDMLPINENLVVWVEDKTPKSLSRNTLRKVYYKVRPGDSLYLIAQKFNVTVNKIMNWNKSLGHQKYIQPGDSIRLLVDVTQVL